MGTGEAPLAGKDRAGEAEGINPRVPAAFAGVLVPYGQTPPIFNKKIKPPIYLNRRLLLQETGLVQLSVYAPYLLIHIYVG